MLACSVGQLRPQHACTLLQGLPQRSPASRVHVHRDRRLLHLWAFRPRRSSHSRRHQTSNIARNTSHVHAATLGRRPPAPAVPHLGPSGVCRATELSGSSHSRRRLPLTHPAKHPCTLSRMAGSRLLRGASLQVAEHPKRSEKPPTSGTLAAEDGGCHPVACPCRDDARAAHRRHGGAISLLGTAPLTAPCEARGTLGAAPSQRAWAQAPNLGSTPNIPVTRAMVSLPEISVTCWRERVRPRREGGGGGRQGSSGERWRRLL